MLEPYIKQKIIEQITLVDNILPEKPERHKWKNAFAKYQKKAAGKIIMKDHSNVDVKIRRIVKQYNRDVDDLVFLAKYIDDDDFQAKLLPSTKISELVSAVLGLARLRELREKLGQLEGKTRLEHEEHMRKEKDSEKRKASTDAHQAYIQGIAAHSSFHPKLDAHKTELAAKIIKECLDYCYEQYCLVEKGPSFQKKCKEGFDDTETTIKDILLKVQETAKNKKRR
jgi:hypothetical protein